MKQLTTLLVASVMIFGVAGCGENTTPKNVQQMAANSTDQSLENAVKDSSDRLKVSTPVTVEPKADVEKTEKDAENNTTAEPNSETSEAPAGVESTDPNTENAPVEPK